MGYLTAKLTLLEKAFKVITFTIRKNAYLGQYWLIKTGYVVSLLVYVPLGRTLVLIVLTV